MGGYNVRLESSDGAVCDYAIIHVTYADPHWLCHCVNIHGLVFNQHFGSLYMHVYMHQPLIMSSKKTVIYLLWCNHTMYVYTTNQGLRLKDLAQ